VFGRFPFFYRAALLLGLMAIAVAVDFWRHGREASKHREYGFIWIAGILAGVVGFTNDCATSSISPDYFVLGKGLEAGNDLRLRAGVYGFKAGLSAGIVGGAICLFARARNSRFSAEQMRRLLLALWMPALGAVLLGLALLIVVGAFDPMGLSARLDSLLNADQIIRFRKVWWIHTGLYAGLVIGLAAMIIRHRGQAGFMESNDRSPCDGGSAQR
jgi:hypothetical protein